MVKKDDNYAFHLYNSELVINFLNDFFGKILVFI